MSKKVRLIGERRIPARRVRTTFGNKDYDPKLLPKTLSSEINEKIKCPICEKDNHFGGQCEGNDKTWN